MPFASITITPEKFYRQGISYGDTHPVNFVIRHIPVMSVAKAALGLRLSEPFWLLFNIFRNFILQPKVPLTPIFAPALPWSRLLPEAPGPQESSDNSWGTRCGAGYFPPGSLLQVWRSEDVSVSCLVGRLNAQWRKPVSNPRALDEISRSGRLPHRRRNRPKFLRLSSSRWPSSNSVHCLCSWRTMGRLLSATTR